MRALCVFLAWSAPTLAWGGGVLVGEQVAVGVAKDGSLCDDQRKACILFDPGPGTPMGSDLLLPGRPFETWSASFRVAGVDRSIVAAAPDTQGGPTLVWETGRRAGHVWADGRGEAGPFGISASVDVPLGEARVVTTLRLEAREDVTDLYIARTVDSDPDFFANGDFQTTNYATGDTVVAAARRLGGKVLALSTPGGVAAVCAGWCMAPADVLAGQPGPVDGDRVIGVVRGPFSVRAGESVTLRFGYGLALSGDEAAAIARNAASDDVDGDGSPLGEDCDERDAASAPGLPERADGRDNDCDGEVDEDGPATDDDGDGFSEADGDCDDGEARAFPGAAPVQGVRDANCDGVGDAGSFDDGAPPEGWGIQEERPTTGACDVASGAGWWLIALTLCFVRRRP
jgi:hypothetical protein